MRGSSSTPRRTPGYAALLSRLPSIELTVVHLVRDPVAIAVSRRRRSERIGRPDYLRLSQLGLMWTVWNPVLEVLGRRSKYVRVAYSEFASRPHASLAAIAELAGLEDARFPFLDGRSASVRPTHSVRGNRSRFETGTVAIAPDELVAHRRPAIRARAKLDAGAHCAGAAPLQRLSGVERAQRAHTFADRRVRIEERGEPVVTERIDDVQRLGGRVLSEDDELAGQLESEERVREPVR